MVNYWKLAHGTHKLYELETTRDYIGSCILGF